MPEKRVCPRCGQDWVHQYRFKGDGTRFSLCTECDSLWWPGETVDIPQAKFLDDVVAARLGVGDNPWLGRVWADVIEPVPDPTESPGRGPSAIRVSPQG
ncbi:hypothetical protein ACIBAG_07765 [Streptomyces sp. NPDC051243]|uniref:hypothetical protein n=1 Tax=Streptomyces sp. NPDC051243 TaxID=3365646 RepID=UPI0037A43EDF